MPDVLLIAHDVLLEAYSNGVEWQRVLNDRKMMGEIGLIEARRVFDILNDVEVSA